MKEEKIYNILETTKTIKRKLSHQGKIFKVYLKKDSPAKVNLFGQVIVDEVFIKTFSKQEQIGILYHEEYHSKYLTSLKEIFYMLRYLSDTQKRFWQEEFDADTYATRKVGKKVMISLLKKSERLYSSGKVKYSSKTHPPVSLRIKNVLGQGRK